MAMFMLQNCNILLNCVRIYMSLSRIRVVSLLPNLSREKLQVKFPIVNVV